MDQAMQDAGVPIESAKYRTYKRWITVLVEAEECVRDVVGDLEQSRFVCRGEVWDIAEV
jgi:hypothetical protein